LTGSRSPFEKEAFKKRVFDPEFPENDRYAELLVQEIPAGQRYSVLVEVFRDRLTGSERKLPYFFSALLAAVTHDEREQFLQVVSEELKTTDSDDALRTIRRILPENYWPRLTEIARLRAEGIFLRAVRSGRYDTKKGRCPTGALGTWLSGIEHHVCDTDQLESVLAEKLTSEDPLQRSYVLQFFFSRLPVWVRTPPFSLGEIPDAIEQRLKAGDESVNQALISLLARRKSQTDWWQTRFKEALENFVPASMQFEPSITDDDVPF
jgi:hypothetical protein